MMINTSFYALVLMILSSIFAVMHSAEPKDPCPSNKEYIVADMCTYDSVVEDNNYGSKVVDSVLLRITKQQNNCTCYVTLHNPVTNYTIYMSKYDGMSSSAPVQSNCGLAVDVEYQETSGTTQSLTSIACTTGTSIRSITLGGSELNFKSRIIAGDFTRGYCMQIFRNESINDCKMNDLSNKAGSDADWISSTQISSVDECKQYCLQTAVCVAVHYEYDNNYCYVYNRTTITDHKDDAVYSQKQCVDTQKLKIRCLPPDSKNQTSQGTTTNPSTKTSQGTTTKPATKTSQGYPPELTTHQNKGTTTEDNRSAKTETTSISDSTMTSSETQSSLTAKNDTTKDKNSDLYVYLGAAAGGVLMILLIVCIIVCIRKRINQTPTKESKNDATQQFCREDRDSDNDYGGLKDNVLYVSSEPNEILEDGNYNTVDLEQARKVNQDISFDGNYSTVDGTCSIIGSYSDGSLSKAKPVIKPKPKTNSSIKRGSDEETIHLSTMDNSNNEYAVVDKGRNSDAVKHINPEHGNDTEYAVVNKVRKSSNKN